MTALFESHVSVAGKRGTSWKNLGINSENTWEANLALMLFERQPDVWTMEEVFHIDADKYVKAVEMLFDLQVRIID